MGEREEKRVHPEVPGGFASWGAGDALCQPRAASVGLGSEQDPLPSLPTPKNITVPYGHVPGSLHFTSKGKKAMEREEERRKNPPSDSLYILPETITGTRCLSL